MDLKEFKKNATDIQEVCTVNAWGFGGFVGNVYFYDSLKFSELYYYTRHQGKFKHFSYYDGDKEITRKDFLNKLKEL